MAAGGDCINDVEVLRAGASEAVLGHRVMAPSTCGTFLRPFTFGHVRQLDAWSEFALAGAWAGGRRARIGADDHRHRLDDL